jgi:hypothetical protein
MKGVHGIMTTIENLFPIKASDFSNENDDLKPH